MFQQPQFSIPHPKMVMNSGHSVRRKLLTWGLFLSGAAWLGGLQGCGSESHPQSLENVIIIVQENRAPDNLFHGLRNADIANTGINSRGETIPLHPVSLAAAYDFGHGHKGFVASYNNGRMDGADRFAVVCVAQPHCAPLNPQFVYVPPSEVKPYFDLAEQYTFADRMFQTNQGPSFPAHQFLIAGTSAPTATSDLFAAENPFWRGREKFIGFVNSGCAAPHQLLVNLIDPAGNESLTSPTCFEHPTLPDLLDAKSLSWRYYSVGDYWNELWNAPSAIRHLRYGPDWAKVMRKDTEIFNDIASGHLPTVSWVIPDGRYSDHPGANEGSGPSWVAAIVNAVGQSRYWLYTTIIITWDDWGGFYDHVAPPIYNSYEYGFRVPLIVVSPYAKRGYVSHVTHDFGSILRFVEEKYGLPSLGYADSRADDLSDCFDYSQRPLNFHTIPAPLTAKYFIEDKRPSTPPDDY